MDLNDGDGQENGEGVRQWPKDLPATSASIQEQSAYLYAFSDSIKSKRTYILFFQYYELSDEVSCQTFNFLFFILSTGCMMDRKFGSSPPVMLTPTSGSKCSARLKSLRSSLERLILVSELLATPWAYEHFLISTNILFF